MEINKQIQLINDKINLIAKSVVIIIKVCESTNFAIDLAAHCKLGSDCY